MYVCAEVLNKDRLVETPTREAIITLTSHPSHSLPFSNHWKERTARAAPSTAFPATEACTRRPPATAHRCSPSTRLQRPPLQIRPTALGRKNQILLKSGPSPGACMKADVSSTQAAFCPQPHLRGFNFLSRLIKNRFSVCGLERGRPR